MNTFDSYSPDALQFLRDLKANNTKDWFTAHKTTYEHCIKDPTKVFAAHMESALGALTGQPHSSKIFRIHRDVRFSKDKTPYNAHIHVTLRPERTTAQPPMWFFGLSPEKLTLGCGVFQYDNEALANFRRAMAGPKGAELIALTDELRASGIRIGEPDLKRVPKGFDKDHPNEVALRRKGFAAWIDITDTAFVTEPDLVERSTATFQKLIPVFDLLSDIGSPTGPC
ncbi:DUF2461 domain-containing protein [Phaeobacter sp. JH18-32]|uniref:DUF2461 domain-containing protein n=1 Tax=Phaeobacter TaxID=302485 RepID=UPI003A87846C